jgi:hypothetical protein
LWNGKEMHMAIRSKNSPSQPRAQRGAVAVIVAAMLVVLLGVCGLAIDLGAMYNRRVEMQDLADAAALAAAGELDGTSAGVTRALSRAAAVAASFHYEYVRGVTWDAAAIRFGTQPAHNGEWVAGETARTAPDGRLFARVDTLALDRSQGLVKTMFMQIFAGTAEAVLQGHAIAGRTGIKVAPLAICANSDTAAEGRDTGAGKELVEFGFRRGVSYDLMQLNPHGTTPENFVVNPFAPPGVTGTSGPTSPSIVGPYICTGTMSTARVTGGTLTVARPFPLAALADQLNSRFDQYTANTCSRVSAPPDINIKAYTYTGITWMSTAPLGQSAQSLTVDNKLLTVADPAPAPAGNTAGMYGPLWVAAKAIPWSAYVPGTPEPATGYTTFASSAWQTLYDPGKPAVTAYPASVPYLATAGDNFRAPSVTVRGQRNRRVLNVLLLSCPVASGTNATATALGVGKFFMTVPATTTALYAEFGGIVPEQALATSTGLFP